MTKFYWTDLRLSIAETLRDLGEVKMCEIQKALDIPDFISILRAVKRLVDLGLVERNGEPYHYTYRLSEQGFALFFEEEVV